MTWELEEAFIIWEGEKWESLERLGPRAADMQESGSKLLVSYLVLCTGQHSNGVKRSDVLPCSLRMLNAYVSYYVVDHSLTAICQARLSPQVRCQPKDGVRADVSFHREARAWSADSLLVDWGLYHNPPTFFLKHNVTQARHLSSGVWLVCSLLSHKFGEGDGIVQNLVGPMCCIRWDKRHLLWIAENRRLVAAAWRPQDISANDLSL